MIDVSKVKIGANQPVTIINRQQNLWVVSGADLACLHCSFSVYKIEESDSM